MKVKKEEKKLPETTEKFEIKVMPVDDPKFSGNVSQYAAFFRNYKIMASVVGCEAGLIKV